MNMKLMVYPSSFEASIFRRYMNLIEKYDKVYLAGPSGWLLPNFDMEDIEDLKAYRQAASFEEALPFCDDVLFLDTSPSPSADNLMQKIQAAIAAGKKVYIDYGEKLAALSIPEKNIERVHNHKEVEKIPTSQDIVHIFEIPVPVVFVLGAGPNTGKFDLQLALREAFLKKGYSLAQIGSKRISSFWGMEAMPAWITTNEFTTREKIMLLNRYFYEVYLENRPDVMMIGIPGGIMPINPLVFEDMGETAFIISNAISADAAVLSIYAHKYNQRYFDELRALCKYRLNLNLKYVAVSNMDITVSTETHMSEFTPISPETVESEFLFDKGEFHNIELFNLYKKSDMSALAEKLMGDLRNNL